MGYCATWNGWIKFKKPLASDDMQTLEDVFVDSYKESDTVYDYFGNGKYYDDSVCEALEQIENNTEAGVIEFSGEDGYFWRWIFKDGSWLDENGHITYDSDELNINENKEEFIGQIIDVIQDCIDNPKSEIIDGKWYQQISDNLISIMKTWGIIK